MKHTVGKNTLLIVGVGLMLIFLSLWVTISQSDDKQPYPGNGVYDLSEYMPYEVSGVEGKNGIYFIGLDFKTNTCEINLENNGNETVTVYLYNKHNPVWDSIGEMILKPGKSNHFTMLTAATEYQIGVDSHGSEYMLAISD